MRPRTSAIGLTLAGYVAFALVLTWPLGAALTTHLPQVAGAFASDLYYVGWALAWQTHALTTSPAEFANANIYGGVPFALFYGTPGFGLLPIYAPFFVVTGNPTLALNGARPLPDRPHHQMWICGRAGEQSPGLPGARGWDSRAASSTPTAANQGERRGEQAGSSKQVSHARIG